ncbi:hypothetical protein AWC15_22140 [Mycobacterium lacus]|uniref:Uncharacterized protein n=1 Tax=Mycobacterium lacus TaxID=169765 RepID=A0A1X1Y5J8_9MYCO|nr:hypothetical protein [Mycobacterium lacus]ORW06339.1 hypothetical protein AWC15_22140 [Mycobacterium lacus]BBX97746.1 hypothetical protein MLAC_30400 [Mycobacterium lacus]
MSGIEVVLPFWLDRPDLEAVDVAQVGLALGISSVASLTASPVDIALGGLQPAIVAGWHHCPWGPGRAAATGEAGADCGAVVPATAEDPGGRVTLEALTRRCES